jgi:hypothetical protein
MLPWSTQRAPTASTQHQSGCARRVSVNKGASGDSRSLTVQPGVLLTCVAAGPLAAATSFPRWCPSSSLLDGRGRVRRVKAIRGRSPAWTRRPRPVRAATRRTGEEQGTREQAALPPGSRRSAHVAGPLAALAGVTRGQPGSLGAVRDAWSVPLAAVTVTLPKPIVRVRLAPHDAVEVSVKGSDLE